MRVRPFDGPRNFQATDARQVHFDDQQGRVGVFDQLDGLLAVAGFSDKAKVGRCDDVVA
jgi:hypothetical protein